MFREFFAEKCERDGLINRRWITFLEEKEDQLTPEIRKTFSRLLNSHHIWNCRLKQIIPESDINDVLPVIHWQQLQLANTRDTLTYLDDFSAEEKLLYHDSEGVQLEQLAVNILFQLLQDNQFYRGQLALLCTQQGWEAVDELLISL